MINRQLVFIGDTSSQAVRIRTIEDEAFEGQETFFVLITLITLLSGPGMAEVDNRHSNITVVIDDDDPRITGRKLNYSESLNLKIFLGGTCPNPPPLSKHALQTLVLLLIN